MGSPTEFWVGKVLVFLYDDGFTIFHGTGAEFTEYFGLLLVVAVATPLLLIAKCLRPAMSWLALLAGAAALGAAGMWLGVTGEPLFSVSTVRCVLAMLGIPLGLLSFALAALVWRELRLMGVRRAQVPSAPHRPPM